MYQLLLRHGWLTTDRPCLIITTLRFCIKQSVVTSNAVHHLNSVPASADVAALVELLLDDVAREEMEEYKP